MGRRKCLWGLLAVFDGGRILQARAKIRKARTLRLGRRPKVLITRASIQAGAMYACETDPLTQKQLHELRVISAVAMNYDWGGLPIVWPPCYSPPRASWNRSPCIIIGFSKTGAGK